jgi:precorrin-2 methylase
MAHNFIKALDAVESRDKICLNIAKRNSLVRKSRQAVRHSMTPNGNPIETNIIIPEDLTTQNSDSDDFYEVAVWDIKKALEEAFNAGFRSAIGVAEKIEEQDGTINV